MSECQKIPARLTAVVPVVSLFELYPIPKHLSTTSFRIQGVPMNNLAPMKNCPGVQGNLFWMQGYLKPIKSRVIFGNTYCLPMQ